MYAIFLDAKWNGAVPNDGLKYYPAELVIEYKGTEKDHRIVETIHRFRPYVLISEGDYFVRKLYHKSRLTQTYPIIDV